MKRILPFIFVIICITTESALSCSDMPFEYQVRYYELIERTEDIVLANVSRIDTLNNSKIEYHFSTVENLRGDKYINSFTLTYPIIESDASSFQYDDFDKHRSRYFWELGGSRTFIDVDCLLYPVFQIGHSYLLFLDEKDHRMGYEMIKSEDDLWLEVVKKVLNSDNFSYRYTKNVFEWLETADAVLVYEYIEHEEYYFPKKVEQISGNEYELNMDIHDRSEEDLGKFIFVVYIIDGHEDLSFPYPVENGIINFHYFITHYEVTEYENVALDTIKQHFNK